MNRIEEHREVTGIVLFFMAVVVMLFFYLPVTFTGVLGEVAKAFFMGLFGFTAYAIPVYLLYAAIDFFFEKRAGVSKIRVVSVILFLISISSLLALITMDIAYISALSSEGEKVIATKALDLLWRSGSDASLIQNTALAMKVIPGGIIGGSIAIGLNMITGKAIGIILICVFLLAQIVTVFHISIKRAAKQTVNMIGKTAQKAYTRVTAPVKNTNTYARPVSGTTVMTYGQNPTPYPAQPQTSASPFVNTGRPKPVNRYPAPSVGSDPFGSSFPIDATSGFTDVERLGLASNDENSRDTINFNGRDYNTNEEHPTADFNYNAEPKNAPIRMKKQQKELSFLKDNSQDDFYDLTPQQMSAPEPEEPLEDMPSEIIEDDSNGNDYDYSRSVRRPYVDPSIFGGEAAPAEESIAINASNAVEGYSETEGRMFKTSNAAKPVQRNSSVNFGDAGKATRAIDNTGRAYQIRGYKPAPTKLLAEDIKEIADPNTNKELRESANKLVETLASFGINDTKVINIIHGPSITRFELTIPAGVKVSRVTQLKDDIKQNVSHYTLKIKELNRDEKITAQDVGLEYVDDGKVDELMEEQEEGKWFLHLAGTTEFDVNAGTKYDEGKVTETIAGLECFKEENVTKPQNATLRDENNVFSIQDEVEGNEVNLEKFTAAVKEALDKGGTSIDIVKNDCYNHPTIYRDNETLKARMDKWNEYMRVNVTYAFGDNIEVVNADTVKPNVVDDGSTVDLPTDWIRTLVYGWGQKYDTFGLAREFTTHSGETVMVEEGGDYGWVIDKDVTIADVTDAILTGAQGERPVTFLYSAMGWDNGDLTGTYVEVSIAEQHLWCYKDYELVMDTDVVTGLPTTERGTTPGTFAVDAKKEDAVLGSLDVQGYESPVSFWAPFNGGQGLHDAPWRSDFGGDIYLSNGSHGCVNIPPENMEAIYNAIDIGTAVVVY